MGKDRGARAALADVSGGYGRVIPLGERHLRTLVAEYVLHYHLERNHQGVGNRLLSQPPTSERVAQHVVGPAIVKGWADCSTIIIAMLRGFRSIEFSDRTGGCTLHGSARAGRSLPHGPQSRCQLAGNESGFPNDSRNIEVARGVVVTVVFVPRHDAAHHPRAKTLARQRKQPGVGFAGGQDCRHFRWQVVSCYLPQVDALEQGWNTHSADGLEEQIQARVVLRSLYASEEENRVTDRVEPNAESPRRNKNLLCR
jgi:hypothetical protein